MGASTHFQEGMLVGLAMCATPALANQYASDEMAPPAVERTSASAQIAHPFKSSAQTVHFWISERVPGSSSSEGGTR